MILENVLKHFPESVVMSQISKRPIKKELAKRINNLFVESIVTCRSPEETLSYLDGLLSDTEKIMLSKRLAIAYLLTKGVSYRTINQTIKVSNPTIRAVDRMLSYKGEGIKKILEKITKSEKWSKFFEELADILVETVGKSKGSNWSTTNSILRQRKIEKKALF